MHYRHHALSFTYICASYVVNFYHSWLLPNHRTDFDGTLEEASTQLPLWSLCFPIRPENNDGRLSLWLTRTFSISPPQTLEGIERNFTGSKYTTSSIKFVFRPDQGRLGLWLIIKKVARGAQVNGIRPFYRDSFQLSRILLPTSNQSSFSVLFHTPPTGQPEKNSTIPLQNGYDIKTKIVITYFY